MAPPQKKKKTDFAALSSSFMKIPSMKVEIARGLLDAGVQEVYQLQGRSPEGLFEELKKKRPDVPADFLPWFRLAVYYAETPEPDQRLLHVNAWMG